MDYNDFVAKWIKEKRQMGLSPDAAYRTVAEDIRGLNQALERSSLTKRQKIMPAAIKALKKYIKHNATSCKDGKCYFYPVGLPYNAELKRAGIIRRAGTRPELKKLGIDIDWNNFPFGSLFYGVLYEVKENLLSDDIYERRRT